MEENEMRDETLYQEPEVFPGGEAELPPEDPEQFSEGSGNGMQERVQREVTEFIQRFPDVRPEALSQEVWEGVRQGMTLSDAYRDWQGRQLEAENQWLRQELEAGKANARNAARSVGSQKTAGAAQGKDFFLAALLGE